MLHKWHSMLVHHDWEDNGELTHTVPMLNIPFIVCLSSSVSAPLLEILCGGMKTFPSLLT